MDILDEIHYSYHFFNPEYVGSGDEFELRELKGALVQEKWTVQSTRVQIQSHYFTELEISLDGQTRLGKNVGGTIEVAADDELPSFLKKTNTVLKFILITV